jgi:hypothetical protein
LLDDPLSDHAPHSELVSIGAPMRLHVDRLAPIIGGHWADAAAQWQALRGQAFTSDFVGALGVWV